MQEFSTYPKAKRLIKYLANQGFEEAIEALELYNILSHTEGDFIAARFMITIFQELEEDIPQTKLINI